MIFSFTTQGRDCIATMAVGLSVVPINDAGRGESYRSGFRSLPAAVPPNRAFFLLRMVLGTCRGRLPNESAPGLFNSSTVTTTRLSV